MYKALLLIAMVGGLAGCTTSRQITGQDGKPVHAISCNGAANSMQSCYEKAGDVCGTAGFDVMGSDGSSTPFGVPWQAFLEHIAKKADPRIESETDLARHAGDTPGVTADQTLDHEPERPRG